MKERFMNHGCDPVADEPSRRRKYRATTDRNVRALEPKGYSLYTLLGLQVQRTIPIVVFVTWGIVTRYVDYSFPGPLSRTLRIQIAQCWS